jgi:hypothetical protein
MNAREPGWLWSATERVEVSFFCDEIDPNEFYAISGGVNILGAIPLPGDQVRLMMRFEGDGDHADDDADDAHDGTSGQPGVFLRPVVFMVRRRVFLPGFTPGSTGETAPFRVRVECELVHGEW